MNSCPYYSSFMYTKCFYDVLTVVFFHKSCHKCFARSGPFLQIRSHIAVKPQRENETDYLIQTWKVFLHKNRHYLDS